MGDMSCNYKSVCQIAVGDILTKDCRVKVDILGMLCQFRRYVPANLLHCLLVRGRRSFRQAPMYLTKNCLPVVQVILRNRSSFRLIRTWESSSRSICRRCRKVPLC